MGWRDRDWAKLEPSELEAIYGGARPSTPHSVVRRGAWPAILVSVVATLALGRLHVLHLPALQRGGAAPVVYGQPLRDGSVCTHLRLMPGSGWNCLEARIGLQGVRVVALPTYAGPCTEIVADESHGVWACVGSST